MNFATLGNSINIYIWCAIGGLIGFLGGFLMQSAGRMLMVENVLVGAFGAVVGGEFVIAMITKGPVSADVFSARGLLFAVAGAVVAVLLLRLMRRAVGPMRLSKSKQRR